MPKPLSLDEKKQVVKLFNYFERERDNNGALLPVSQGEKCFATLTQDSLRPRRALMYVPGNDQKKLNKAFNLNVDCIAMDCEDGVAINKKQEARENIRSILDKGKPNAERNYDLGVRLNAINTEYFLEDVKSVFGSNNLPDTVLLPKVDSPENIKEYRILTEPYLKKHAKKTDLIIYIESAKAVINSVEICKTAAEEGVLGNFRPAAIVFGGDDFIADVGAAKSHDFQEVSYARQKVVLVAKAFQMQAIDVVHIQFKELDQLKEQALQGARLGYTGKQVIHPDQVPIVQEAFLPTQKQIQWATGLLEAFEEHQKLGKGAFTFKGSMIDMPTMKQAQNILNLLKAVT